MLDLRLSASCCSWETCSGVSSSWWCSRSCSVWYTKAKIGCWCFWMSLWKACKQIHVNACHILMIGRELHLIYMTVYSTAWFNGTTFQCITYNQVIKITENILTFNSENLQNYSVLFFLGNFHCCLIHSLNNLFPTYPLSFQLTFDLISLITDWLIIS